MSFYSRSRQFLFRHTRRIAHQFGLPVLINGVKLKTVKIQSSRILHHIFDGSYESAEAQSIRRLVNLNDRVLELGSGLGYVTCLAARQAKHGSILSVEANPSMTSIARKNVELNRIKNVEVRNGVLGKQQGTTSFYVSQHFWESSLSRKDGWSEKRVPVLSSAGILREFKPTVLIMDIEGGEYELLTDPVWSSNEGPQKISVEFHIGENTEHLLEKLSVYKDNWQWSMSLQNLARRLRTSNTTVTFSRKNPSEC